MPTKDEAEAHSQSTVLQAIEDDLARIESTININAIRVTKR